MLILDIEGKEVKIPQSYEEMTVTKFSGIWKILTSHTFAKEGEELTEEQVLMEIEKDSEITRKIIGYLLDIDDPDNIDYQQAQEILVVFNNLMDNSSLLEKDYGDEKGFYHEGEWYEFPRKLLNENVTFGEYAEHKQIEQIFGKDMSNKYDYIPKQMAIWCRKAGEDKDSYDKMERENLFRTVTMDKVMMFTFFLTKRMNTLLPHFQTFMEKKGIDFTGRSLTSSQDMVGSTQSMM